MSDRQTESYYLKFRRAISITLALALHLCYMKIHIWFKEEKKKIIPFLMKFLVIWQAFNI